MTVDLERLTLTELIHLQQELAQTLQRRFERRLALAFTDIVGSTAYFHRHGDVAGRALQQRHLDLLREALEPTGGRIVDTAGDGAFACFPDADAAAASLAHLERRIVQENASVAAAHRLVVRAGLHWGPVLTDGTVATGDSSNVCARIMDLAQGGEILLSRDAFLQLSNRFRIRCQPHSSAELKGLQTPVEVMRLEWREEEALPTHVEIEETGERIALPDQALITFGRLRQQGGKPANDVVLALPEASATKRISRWHFQLERHPDGYRLRSVSEAGTEVDGRPVASGEEVPVGAGQTIRCSGVITVRLLAETRREPGAEGETTILR